MGDVTGVPRPARAEEPCGDGVDTIQSACHYGSGRGQPEAPVANQRNAQEANHRQEQRPGHRGKRLRCRKGRNAGHAGQLQRRHQRLSHGGVKRELRLSHPHERQIRSDLVRKAALIDQTRRSVVRQDQIAGSPAKENQQNCQPFAAAHEHHPLSLTAIPGRTNYEPGPIRTVRTYTLSQLHPWQTVLLGTPPPVRSTLMVVIVRLQGGFCQSNSQLIQRISKRRHEVNIEEFHGKWTPGIGRMLE